jgi:DNA replication licensing factor MCM3
LIRLSTAHAKARLSPTVNEIDAIAAEEILRFALFKEVMRAKSKKSKKNKKRKINGTQTTRNGSHDSDSSDAEGSEDGTDAEEEEEEAEAAANKRMEMPTSAKKQPNGRYPSRGTTADRSTSVATGTQGDDSGVGMNTTILRSEASPAPGEAARRRATPLRDSSTQPEGDATMDDDTQEQEADTQQLNGLADAAQGLDPARWVFGLFSSSSMGMLMRSVNL